VALTYKDVAEIIKIIDASSCEEVVVELADTKIVVRRGAGANAVFPSTSTSAIESKTSSVPLGTTAQWTNVITDASAATGGQPGKSFVRSPMTGTFYRASSPTAAPFVEIGSLVKSGDTLCSIEVMKLFTTITAETGGRITRIFAMNAELVQFDQPLFEVESDPPSTNR
jgi:acetyl-CoA carboxylase biotin carboxyl carrier protein